MGYYTKSGIYVTSLFDVMFILSSSSTLIDLIDNDEIGEYDLIRGSRNSFPIYKRKEGLNRV